MDSKPQIANALAQLERAQLGGRRKSTKKPAAGKKSGGAIMDDIKNLAMTRKIRSELLQTLQSQLLPSQLLPSQLLPGQLLPGQLPLQKKHHLRNKMVATALHANNLKWEATTKNVTNQ
jgi:hypothetical protein